jgi:hypothetical protein
MGQPNGLCEGRRQKGPVPAGKLTYVKQWRIAKTSAPRLQARLFALLAFEQCLEHLNVRSAGADVCEHVISVGCEGWSAHPHVRVPVVRDPMIQTKVSAILALSVQERRDAMGCRSIKINRTDSCLGGRNHNIWAKHQVAWESEDSTGAWVPFEPLLKRFAEPLRVSALIEVIPLGTKIIQVDPVAFREPINLQV